MSYANQVWRTQNCLAMVIWHAISLFSACENHLHSHKLSPHFGSQSNSRANISCYFLWLFFLISCCAWIKGRVLLLRPNKPGTFMYDMIKVRKSRILVLKVAHSEFYNIANVVKNCSERWTCKFHILLSVWLFFYFYFLPSFNFSQWNLIQQFCFAVVCLSCIYYQILFPLI